MSAATECPKCGFKGENPDQCDRCGIIFDRMHTVLDTRPLGAQMAAAREAYIAQRQAARTAPPSAPTVEVSADAKTVVEVPRVVANRPGLSGPLAALEQVRANPHASTIPALAPVAQAQPASLERIGVEVVPRQESRRGGWIAFLCVAVVGGFV